MQERDHALRRTGRSPLCRVPAAHKDRPSRLGQDPVVARSGIPPLQHSGAPRSPAPSPAWFRLAVVRVSPASIGGAGHVAAFGSAWGRGRLVNHRLAAALGSHGIRPNSRYGAGLQWRSVSGSYNWLAISGPCGSAPKVAICRITYCLFPTEVVPWAKTSANKKWITRCRCRGRWRQSGSNAR
jgi:hypothetical protein